MHTKGNVVSSRGRKDRAASVFECLLRQTPHQKASDSCRSNGSLRTEAWKNFKVVVYIAKC